MEKIYGGLGVIVVFAVIIGFLFGDAAANDFIHLVAGFFQGIFNIVNAILSIVL